MVVTLSGAELIGEVSKGKTRAFVHPGRAGGLEVEDSYLCQFDNIHHYIYIYHNIYIYTVSIQ